MADSDQRVEAAIKAFAKGEIAVVTDDDERENEATCLSRLRICTPKKMAFIIRNTSGIVCAPWQPSRRGASIEPMVADNEAPLGTAFTVSVDVRHGLTTGISADERCNTVRALANGNSGPADFVRPGHVFPLVAREGGVLMRPATPRPASILRRLTRSHPSACWPN